MDPSLINALIHGGEGASAVLGVWVVLMICGRVVPAGVVEDRDRQIAERDATIVSLTDALTRANDALLANKDAIAALQMGLVAAGREPAPRHLAPGVVVHGGPEGSRAIEAPEGG